MKRLLVWISLLLLLLLPAGCAHEEEPVQEPWPLRAAMILPHNDDDYFSIMSASAVARAEELGIDIKVSWPQLNYNIPQITDLIREATAARVDAIITQGAEIPSYLAALEEAAQAGIQVILVDTDVAGDSDYLYVGTDNVEAGRILGRELVRVTGGACVAAVISGSEHLSNMEQRLAGLEEILAQEPGIELRRVEYGNYDSITIMEKYHLILQEDPDVTALVCLEGTGGVTFSRVLTRETCPVEHILAFDLTDNAILGIQSGLLDGVVFQDQSQMGSIALEEALRFAREGSYSGSVHYTDTFFVSAENLDEVLSKAANYGQ